MNRTLRFGSSRLLVFCWTRLARISYDTIHIYNDKRKKQRRFNYCSYIVLFIVCNFFLSLARTRAVRAGIQALNRLKPEAEELTKNDNIFENLFFFKNSYYFSILLAHMYVYVLCVIIYYLFDQN